MAGPRQSAGDRVKVLLDEQRVFVTYGSASVVRADRDPDGDDFAVETDEPVEFFDADAYGDALDAAWADGSNGLCGAGVPGVLELQTGTHTGWLPFRVELHDTAPPVDGSWEEVVEVPFTADSGQLALAGLGGDFVEFPLPPRDYRVRYCIRGLDAADTVEQPPDEYLLQFWPAAAAPGRIVKQTAQRAAYWHQARRPQTEQDRADAARTEQDEREKLARDRWGERTPNARLRATLGAGLYLSTISALDPELESALAGVDDEVHRQVDE